MKYMLQYTHYDEIWKDDKKGLHGILRGVRIWRYDGSGRRRWAAARDVVYARRGGALGRRHYFLACDAEMKKYVRGPKKDELHGYDR